MRLINADALIEQTELLCTRYEVRWTDNRVMAWIDNAPTVEAVVLPCKVGDTVYTVIGDDETPHFVDTGKVFAIGIDESNTMWISVRYECGLKYYYPAYDIGETVFLTREEAEAALAERRNGE